MGLGEMFVSLECLKWVFLLCAEVARVVCFFGVEFQGKNGVFLCLFFLLVYDVCGPVEI